MIIIPAWLISDALQPPRREWGLRVNASQIADIAPNDELRLRYPDDEVWEAPQQVLSPGFVNAHTHLYGLLAHGIPLEQAPSGFWPFLREFWWPKVEDRLDRSMICAATALRCVDMLRSGVTSFYDCTEAPHALPGVLNAQAEVVWRAGLRAVLSFEATERISQHNGQLGLEENLRFIERCRKIPGSLVQGMLCFHTTFTCSAKFIQRVFTLADELDVLVHAHVSEGSYEPQFTLERFSQRPMAYYAGLGVLGPRLLASQCVQVDEKEIDLIASSGARVVHMPLSNCEVGGGIAPVPALIAAGVIVGLGSDGYIDDFFEVMRGAFLIHKAAQRDPRLMPANLVWRLATLNGAQALGLAKVGALHPGWQADLQLIDIASLPTPLEKHNLYDQLLLYRNAGHVRAVWVAGKLRVRDGCILEADMHELHNQTRHAAQRLWNAKLPERN